MSNSSTDNAPLTKAAQKAVDDFPESDIEVAMEFLSQASLPDFIGASNDRLVKVGRSVRSLINMSSELNVEQSLELLVQECRLLLSGNVKVPRVPFGSTGLEMPIVTLGCMRFQQEWGPRITHMNQVGSDCQDNLVAILKQAIDYGMVHIETARAYGCSELQLGVALKQLFAIEYVKREDLIIQTKVNAAPKADDFRAELETSFRNLQVDYIDLFAMHGMNLPEHLEWVFGSGDDNCMAVVQAYVKEGKIRHVGFSTHGATELIQQCIEKDVFEYVNLHFHYFGSYTASGGGHDGNGNLENVQLLEKKNMGIFIISPFDKGGRLYAPSQKLRSLTLPDLEPMDFGSMWIWNHHRLDEGRAQLHTFTVGAARPSDLDQPAVAAYLHATQPDGTLAKVQAVVARLEDAKVQALGQDWVDTWSQGLVKANQSKHFVEHNQMVWLYNVIQAFGMYEFAKSRYQSFENNGAKWDDKKSAQENIDAIGQRAWGYVPGLPLRPEIDYTQDDLVNVPKENLERLVQADAFVYKWCANKTKESEEHKGPINFLRRNFSVSRQMFPSFLAKKMEEEEKARNEAKAKADAELCIPKEWETAYDMRPWPDYPDQPSRA